MEDANRQLDFWGTLDGTRVVATTAGTSLTPWQAPTKAEVAKAFADADAQKKDRGSARTTLDLGKVPARGKTAGSGALPNAGQAAKSKGMAIKPARYGNSLVVVPRFRS